MNAAGRADRAVRLRRVGFRLSAVALPLALVSLLIAVSPLPGERIFVDAFRSATGVQAAILALAAVGLNLHFGYTGLLNFGQVGFMLLGAYGLAVTVSTFGGPFWLGILVGVFLAVVLAVLIGLPTLKLRADYLAIVTIAAAEILRFITRSGMATEVTGGVFGLQRFANTFYELNPLPAGTYEFWVLRFPERRLWPILVGWALVAMASLFIWLLIRSPWGRVLRAIREDDEAARALGKNAYAYRLQSLAIGGAIGGLSGALWAVHLQAVTPDQFLPIQTFFVYAALILGGAATIMGPVVGAVLFWFLVSGFDSLIRAASVGGYLPSWVGATESVGAIRFALVGLGIILLMIYRPQGLLGNKREMQLDVR